MKNKLIIIILQYTYYFSYKHRKLFSNNLSLQHFYLLSKYTALIPSANVVLMYLVLKPIIIMLADMKPSPRLG